MAGVQCCENPPVLNPSSGQGNIVDDFGGLKTYITGSTDSKLAVVLVSDVFGFESPNLRKLADNVAAAGFFVVVPDFLHGDPYVPDANTPISTWLQNHGPDKAFEEAKPVIASLKNQGFSAIGAAGFCWGAKVVVELGKSGIINAAVLLHPSFVKIDDIKEITAHVAVLGAEIDQISPPELVKQFEEVLNARSEIKSFVKIFPGVVHGWTVRYDVNDESAVKRAEEAHRDMIDWFVKHLN